MPQIVQRLVGLLEWISGGLGFDPDFRRDFEKIQPVLTRQICDRDNLALLPKIIVRECGDFAHMNTRANDSATFAHGFQRSRHQTPNRSEDDGRIEKLRRNLIRTACPDRAETTSEILGFRIARAGKAIHFAFLPAQNLGNDMRRRTETIEPDALAVSGFGERTPADQPSAK